MSALHAFSLGKLLLLGAALFAPFGPAAPAAASALTLSGPLAASYAVAETAQAITAPAASKTSDKLQSHIDRWIRTLAAEKPFSSWKNAESQVKALGPGTHGWLVTLRADDAQRTPVGYLVVYAAEDGSYRLGEYGLGKQPLFDEAALKRSLVANGLIASFDSPYQAVKAYANPFAAVWQVSVGADRYWLDAKTGELLPIGKKDLDAAAARAAAPSQRGTAEGAAALGEWRLNETFDPYERLPWLQGEKPFPSDDKSVLARLRDAQHLRFVSQPFGDKALYALPVIGYVAWSDGRTDAALDQAGERFIPLSSLRQYGSFYK